MALHMLQAGTQRTKEQHTLHSSHNWSTTRHKQSINIVHDSVSLMARAIKLHTQLSCNAGQHSQHARPASWAHDTAAAVTADAVLHKPQLHSLDAPQRVLPQTNPSETAHGPCPRGDTTIKLHGLQPHPAFLTHVYSACLQRARHPAPRRRPVPQLPGSAASTPIC
jgi:hypothetical protein